MKKLMFTLFVLFFNHFFAGAMDLSKHEFYNPTSMFDDRYGRC
jgi:hypothetical protein